MKRPSPLFAFVPLLWVLASCADGGSSGTGITSAQGNVATAQAWLRPSERTPSFLARLWEALPVRSRSAFARAGTEQIEVSIEGTSLQTRTDANGAFRLSGDFAGPIGLLFERPDDGLFARLVITIPAGGSLTLTNVRLEHGRASVDGQRAAFDGILESTDCAKQIATVVSELRPRDGNRYRVHLSKTEVRDDQGAPLACEDLRPGQKIRVDGAVRDDGAFEADDVEVHEDNGKSGEKKEKNEDKELDDVSGGGAED
jgi:hypothetical protein